MSKIGIGCAAIGALAALVSAIVGVIFINDKEFVVSTIRCNTTQPGSGGNASNCVDNTLVDPQTQEVCQVGNLGLFTAQFTPECTQGQVGYEIPPPFTTNFSTDTTEFGFLFPAQTNFQGLFNISGLEFDNCDDYFANPLLQLAFAGAGQASALSGLPTFLDAVVNGLVDGLTEQVDGLAISFCELTYNETADTLTGFGLPPPPDVTVPYGAPTPAPTYAGFLSAVAPSQPPTVQAQLLGLASIFNTGLLLSPGSTSPLDVFSAACEFGYTGTQGLPEEGFFSRTGSSVICSLISIPNCTYTDAIFASSEPSAVPLQLLLNGFLAGFNADERTVDIRAPFGGTVDFDDLAFIVDNRNLNDFAIAYSFALSKSSFYQNLRNELDIFPDDLFGPTPASGEWIALCASVDLSPGCSFFAFAAATAQGIAAQLAGIPESLATTRKIVQSQLEDLQGLLAIMSVCASNVPPVGNYTLCVNLALQSVINPFTNQTLTDVAADTIFGTFYGTEEGQTFAEYAETAAESCRDDEKDIAALSQAQTLVPPGVYLGFVAAVGVALSAVLVVLGKGGKAAPAVALVSGILALVGVVLIIVALLGILNAPIYASVGGGSGPIEDNTQLRKQGPGAMLVYIVLGTGIVGIGAIFSAAVALFMASRNESEANILKA